MKFAFRSAILSAAFVAGLGFAGGTAVAQDAEAGAKKFAVCKACHKVETGKHGVGPSLFGVVGRPSGKAEGFKYSDAMGKLGKTWDETTIDAYLSDPKGYVPGNKMAFAGLKDATERANVIAYLKTLK